jgi:hypothetical protein
MKTKYGRKIVTKNLTTYTLPYADREDAYIIIKALEEPYGPGSESVVSIGSTLKGDVDNPTWKVHIPMSLVKDVRWALKFANEDNENAKLISKDKKEGELE